MKRFALAAVLTIIIASSAFAYDFGAFTMEVPAGWTASVNGPTGLVIKDDKTASLSLTITPAQGNSAKTFAEAFVEEFKKSFATVTAPVAEKDGSYSWEMSTAEGVKSNAMLAVEDDKCKLVVMTGFDAAAEEIAAMLESVNEK